MEDLNWRRACFWCAGQDRQGKKKKKKKLQKASSRHGFAIDEFLAFFAGELMEVDCVHHDGEEHKDMAHWLGMLGDL